MDCERWGLRLVALGLFITLLTPDIGAPPSNDTPIACTSSEDYLSEALRRFESTIKAQKAIIVVGAEGSGSKLAALAAAQVGATSAVMKSIANRTASSQLLMGPVALNFFPSPRLPRARQTTLHPVISKIRAISILVMSRRLCGTSK